MRLEDERTEVSLLLINNTGDLHAFILPQPSLPWFARIDSAHLQSQDRQLEGASVQVAAHSVQLLTAIIAAEPPATLVHEEQDKAPEPEPAPEPASVA